MSDATSDSFQSDRAFVGIEERYLTPPDAPTGHICRRIYIPDDPGFVAAVCELLSRLCFVEVWEERAGGLTQLETTWLANQMYEDFLKGYCMIGSLVPVITADIPAHMLLCDGATYNRVDYPDLYAVLHSSLILDADTFQVPDLRQRTVIGVDTDYPVNHAGGETTHTLTIEEMPAHDHPQRVRRSSVSGTEDRVMTTGATGSIGLTNGAIDDTGGGLAHNNMQPYRAFPYAVIAR